MSATGAEKPMAPSAGSASRGIVAGRSSHGLLKRVGFKAGPIPPLIEGRGCSLSCARSIAPLAVWGLGAECAAALALSWWSRVARAKPEGL